MEWTREIDIEHVLSFMGGEMHNWFVFCRKHEVTIDESRARCRHLEDTGEIEAIRKEARAIFDARQKEWEENRVKLKGIIDKGTPASLEDKKWLASNEW